MKISKISGVFQLQIGGKKIEPQSNRKKRWCVKHPMRLLKTEPKQKIEDIPFLQ